MATDWTYDTTNKEFMLNSGVSSIDATDFYSTCKEDWATTDSLWKFRFPVASIGGQPIGGGLTIAPYFELLYGWRITPASADQTVVLDGNIITTEGDSPFGDTAGPYHHDFRSIVSASSIGIATADDVWDEAVEGTYTARQLMRIISAALAGKLSGAATSNVAIRDVNDTTDRIAATVDANGNRSSVSLDGD